MDRYARLAKYFVIGILISFGFSLLFARSFAVDGLQGPFVPIGVESVHINGAQSDVSVLYHAQTTGGADVYASAVTPFTAPEAEAQALKKTQDPNGGSLQQQLTNDGFNMNAGEDGFDKDIPPDDPFYDESGTCGATPGMNLSACIATVKAAIADDPDREWSGIKCDATNSFKIHLQTSFLGNPPGTWTFWFSLTSGLCGDQPGAPLPDPGDPDPTDDEMLQELSGNPAPNPLAPNPRPQRAPPPMLSPEFYSEPSSRFFDMTIPTAGPSFSDHSISLTASYDSYTSTTTTAAPLPSGMSFSEPEIGTPISTPTAVDGGTGSGEGESVDTCVANPNSVGCADADGFIASVKSAFDDLLFGTFDFTTLQDPILEEEDRGVTSITPVALAGGSCPVPPTFTVLGSVYTLENSYLCSGLSLLYPVMILLATFSGALLIAGAYSQKA